MIFERKVLNLTEEERKFIKDQFNIDDINALDDDAYITLYKNLREVDFEGEMTYVTDLEAMHDKLVANGYSTEEITHTWEICHGKDGTAIPEIADAIKLLKDGEYGKTARGIAALMADSFGNNTM